MTIKIDIDKWQPFFVSNELQYSVGTASVGNELSRTIFNEQPNFEKIQYHPDNSKLAKRVNNYIVLKGTIKNTWTFDEEDQITSDDIAFALDIVKSDPEHSEAVITTTDNTISFTYKETYPQTTWVGKPFPYELACNQSKLEFLEDSVFVCFMFDENDWQQKVISLAPKIDEYLPDQLTVATKQGSKCYLFFSEHCKINAGGEEILVYQNELKELNSETVTIQNNSNNHCKVVMVYR